MTQPTIARGAPQTDAEMIAALKAERDAYRSQFWDKSIPDLVEMRKQRDDARAAFNVMDGCYKQAVAERDSETRWAHYYFTAWQTARQSRARLVRLVRALHSRHAQDVSDELLAVIDQRDEAIKQAFRAVELMLESAVRSNTYKAERDAARASAAAWKGAARKSFAIRMINRRPPSMRENARSMWGRAIAGTAQDRRARRAAEAMERR